MSFLLCHPRPLTHAPVPGLYARAKEALGQVVAEEEAGAASLRCAYSVCVCGCARIRLSLFRGSEGSLNI
jgi:hypothetical protein